MALQPEGRKLEKKSEVSKSYHLTAKWKEWCFDH